MSSNLIAHSFGSWSARCRRDTQSRPIRCSPSIRGICPRLEGLQHIRTSAVRHRRSISRVRFAAILFHHPEEFQRDRRRLRRPVGAGGGASIGLVAGCASSRRRRLRFEPEQIAIGRTRLRPFRIERFEMDVQRGGRLGPAGRCPPAAGSLVVRRRARRGRRCRATRDRRRPRARRQAGRGPVDSAARASSVAQAIVRWTDPS